MRRLTLAFAATCLSIAAPALAGPPDDFKALTDEYWAYTLREYPTFASTLGVHDQDDKLGDISLAAEDRRAVDAHTGFSRSTNAQYSSVSALKSSAGPAAAGAAMESAAAAAIANAMLRMTIPNRMPRETRPRFGQGKCSFDGAPTRPHQRVCAARDRTGRLRR